MLGVTGVEQDRARSRMTDQSDQCGKDALAQRAAAQGHAFQVRAMSDPKYGQRRARERRALRAHRHIRKTAPPKVTPAAVPSSKAMSPRSSRPSLRA